MPRMSTLTRDDATGVLLHRVGDRWLPLEQAMEEQEARDHARADSHADAADAMRETALARGCHAPATGEAGA